VSAGCCASGGSPTPSQSAPTSRPLGRGAVGADPSQLRTGPAIEDSAAAVASLAIGIPVGLGIGALSVRVLGLFFALPPPLLVVPGGAVGALVLLVLGSSALCLGAALRAVTCIQAGPLLREP
jgi:putative ABC transport system permease protein